MVLPNSIATSPSPLTTLSWVLVNRAIIDNRRVIELIVGVVKLIMVVIAPATSKSKARVSRIFLSTAGGG
jgi:hypothetical protein